MIAQDEKVLNWTSTAKNQWHLKEIFEGWFVQHPDPAKDQQPESIIRVFYALMNKRMKNPNRRTRRPFFTRDELREKVILANKLSEVTFELLWKDNFEMVIQTVQKALDPYYTKPDPADN